MTYSEADVLHEGVSEAAFLQHASGFVVHVLGYCTILEKFHHRESHIEQRLQVFLLGLW